MSPGSSVLCSTYLTACGVTCATYKNDAKWVDLLDDVGPDVAVRRLAAANHGHGLQDFGDCAGSCCGNMICSDANDDGDSFCAYESPGEHVYSTDRFPPASVAALEAMGYEAWEGIDYIPGDDKLAMVEARRPHRCDCQCTHTYVSESCKRTKCKSGGHRSLSGS